MFTVEMEFDETIVTVVDDTGQLPDIKVHLMDDVVYLYQYNEVNDREQLLQITPHMWDEICASMDSPTGAYRKK